MRRAGKRKGQSTLEYILVVGAVLVVVIAAIVAAIRPAVNKTLTDSSKTMEAASDKLKTGLGL